MKKISPFVIGRLLKTNHSFKIGPVVFGRINNVVLAALREWPEFADYNLRFDEDKLELVADDLTGVLIKGHDAQALLNRLSEIVKNEVAKRKNENI